MLCPLDTGGLGQVPVTWVPLFSLFSVMSWLLHDYFITLKDGYYTPFTEVQLYKRYIFTKNKTLTFEKSP